MLSIAWGWFSRWVTSAGSSVVVMGKTDLLPHLSS